MGVKGAKVPFRVEAINSPLIKMFFNPSAYNLYNHKLSRKPRRPLSGNLQCPKEGQHSDRVKSAIRGFACVTQARRQMVAPLQVA
jgi:hypothetical protein